jgi:hypothetical protein
VSLEKVQRLFTTKQKKSFLSNENKIEKEINLRPGRWPVEACESLTKKKHEKQREMRHTRESMGGGGCRSPHQKMSEVTPSDGDLVALQNATMAIGRSRRPRGPTYARGTNRSLFEDPELADNARHLATRRAHPAFKFFYVAHSGSGSFIF